ncbi:MAG: hypothetical protein KJ063_13135 [Anaerolineae bacterium]|nr:hypothetical protein [Anaerolineae bacterium]
MPPILPLTSYSLTLFLAYIHRAAPPVLSGKRLPVAHQRGLQHWLKLPNNPISPEQYRLHWQLAHQVNFIKSSGQHLIVTPRAISWLHDDPAEQHTSLTCALDQLIRQSSNTPASEMVYLNYAHQHLCRTRSQDDTNMLPPAYWLGEPEDDAWYFCLTPQLKPWLLFQLLQLGEWQPEQPLCCTPISLHQAMGRGYSWEKLFWLIEQATRCPFPLKARQQAHRWQRQNLAYHLEPTWLLTTAQPEQLATLLRQKRFRQPHVRQISPRQATMPLSLRPTLDRWLNNRGLVLNGPNPHRETMSIDGVKDEALHWLGLRVLVGLSSYIHLPCPPPHPQLEEQSHQLS